MDVLYTVLGLALGGTGSRESAMKRLCGWRQQRRTRRVRTRGCARVVVLVILDAAVKHLQPVQLARA